MRKLSSLRPGVEALTDEAWVDVTRSFVLCEASARCGLTGVGELLNEARYVMRRLYQGMPEWGHYAMKPGLTLMWRLCRLYLKIKLCKGNPMSVQSTLNADFFHHNSKRKPPSKNHAHDNSQLLKGCNKTPFYWRNFFFVDYLLTRVREVAFC